MPQRPITYADAGVNVDANARFVQTIRSAMAGTYDTRVRSRHGAFAGLFQLDYEEQLFRKNYRKPLLVACADGVGTKVLLAIETGIYHTVGIDLVAMNVNDLMTCGAEPLFFLDYLAVSTLDPQRLATVVEGIADGCRQAGCALLGGETAEMPDLYKKGDFDLAGFAVGVVEPRRLIDPQRVSAGDVLVGLGSSGLHSNGFTLARQVVSARRLALDRHYDELGETLGRALLRPTRIYVQPVRRLLGQYRRKRVVTAMAHITGGGLEENVGRVLPPDCDAIIRTQRWKPPAIFPFLAKLGVERAEMFRVFNMGIGYVLIVRPSFARSVAAKLRRLGEASHIIGTVKRGGGRVHLK